MEVGLGPGHIVLDEDPVFHSEGHSPRFSSHVCCGQTAGWIKMPHGREIGPGPGDIVLDGDLESAPPKRAQQSPSTSDPCLLWPNGWTDQNATWYRGRPWPRPHYLRWGLKNSSLPPKKSTTSNFWPISVVAKLLNGSRCHLLRRQALAQTTLC